MTDRPKTALITGVTGQDGAYLAELLLDKGYTVHGIKRRSSLFNTDRVDHLYQDPHVDHQRFTLHYGDLTDSTNLIRIIQQVQPDEIYNLAAHEPRGGELRGPEYTANADGIGTLRLLEAIRILGLEKKTRFYQASTSELYGLVQETPQKETTPFYPRSPYAVAKLYAYWITVNYREAYGMYACNGILFNHESPLRGETFVTRKITAPWRASRWACRTASTSATSMRLRDWGHARDYVEMQWLMLQQEKPDDFVIATGVQYSVRDFDCGDMSPPRSLRSQAPRPGLALRVAEPGSRLPEAPGQRTAAGPVEATSSQSAGRAAQGAIGSFSIRHWFPAIEAAETPISLAYLNHVPAGGHAAGCRHAMVTSGWAQSAAPFWGINITPEASCHPGDRRKRSPSAWRRDDSMPCAHRHRHALCWSRTGTVTHRQQGPSEQRPQP